jgi:hypothetical protein
MTPQEIVDEINAIRALLLDAAKEIDAARREIREMRALVDQMIRLVRTVQAGEV